MTIRKDNHLLKTAARLERPVKRKTNRKVGNGFANLLRLRLPLHGAPQ